MEAHSAAGMTVNERLYHFGLFESFDVPSGLLYCTLFLDHNYPFAEVRPKRSSHTCSYFVGPGTHRLLVRATFPNSHVRLESNTVCFVAQPNGDVVVRLVFADESLLLQGPA